MYIYTQTYLCCLISVLLLGVTVAGALVGVPAGRLACRLAPTSNAHWNLFTKLPPQPFVKPFASSLKLPMCVIRRRSFNIPMCIIRRCHLGHPLGCCCCCCCCC